MDWVHALAWKDNNNPLYIITEEAWLTQGKPKSHTTIDPICQLFSTFPINAVIDYIILDKAMQKQLLFYNVPSLIAISQELTNCNF